MAALNIEHEKLSLIAWITELQDTKLIQKLQDLKAKNNDIPQWQKDELDKRMEDYKKNPNILLDIKELDKNIQLQ